MERCGEHQLKGQGVAAVWRKTGGLQKNHVRGSKNRLTMDVVNSDKRQMVNEER
jgi:hypothetical protein